VNNFDLKIHSPLIEECKRGNVKAQYRLYNLYSKAMYNISYRMMNNREDAEDILQEAFTECFANIVSFRFESTFGAWLKSIVVNRCINQLKKRKPDLVFDDTLPDYPDVSDYNEETTPDYKKISRAIETLPDGYRVVLNLYLLEGYDHKEISQILGISESTSKTQYLRAKEKLKRILKDERQGR
jgi:RNA polymerase sigma factor (sigma-70 family)